MNNIIRLVHEIALEIIAEGMETESQARAMTGKGVQYLQGFLYSSRLCRKDVLSRNG